jgi:hypothetical protein
MKVILDSDQIFEIKIECIHEGKVSRKVGYGVGRRKDETEEEYQAALAEEDRNPDDYSSYGWGPSHTYVIKIIDEKGDKIFESKPDVFSGGCSHVSASYFSKLYQEGFRELLYRCRY